MGRLWRPLLVGAVVAAATFALAQMAVFEPTAPPAATLAGGDVYRGQLTFERACASGQPLGVRLAGPAGIVTPKLPSPARSRPPDGV